MLAISDAAAAKSHWGQALARMRRPLNACLRTRVVNALCTPHHVDGYLELLDPTWSVREVRARIVRVERAGDGATSLFLQPNENWRGFRAGQFVSLSAAVGGVSFTRCFSISSAPEDGVPLRVTIKALAGGKLGTWAAQAARPGQVVGMTQAFGDFVLPHPAPEQLLFISAGSGMTPIMAMVRQLLATGYRGRLAWLHYARHEYMFADELARLVASHPSSLRFVPVLTRSAGAAAPFASSKHVCADHLTAVAPWWAESDIFLCGPAALQGAVGSLLRERGLERRLHVERFVSPVQFPLLSAASRHRLTFAKSGRAVDASPTISLLELAERAGLQPSHGCRMGICHTCKCRKLSGIVHNELTGALSTEPEDIQLCVSTPRSDVTLAL